jgi:TolB-like protein
MNLKIILFTLFFLTSSLLADTVELKNGKLFENVKANLLKTELQFSFEGKLLVFKKSEVKRIRLKPVLLKPPVTDLEKLEYEKERVRVAEALQQTTDWEMSKNSKISIAILQLSPGSGVSVAEVESVTNLIRTNLVKTKLFIIVDTSLLTKDCPKDGKDCSKLLASNVKINKVVTGTITKLGKKYLLNGNVLDSKNNTIDFAEKATADNNDKLEEAAEYFAKKIAGGIMEYWEESVTAKEQEMYANIQYVWRSALLPGLGQWQYGKDKEESFARKKGIGFGITTIILVGNLFYQGQKLNSAKDNYHQTHNIYFLVPFGSGLEYVGLAKDNSSFSEYQRATNTAKLSAEILIGFYIYNIVDAFFQGKSLFGAKKQTSGFFFFPSKSYANGTKEETYTIGFQYQF